MSNTFTDFNLLIWGITDKCLVDKIKNDYKSLWISSHINADMQIHDFFKGNFKYEKNTKPSVQIYNFLCEVIEENHKEISIAFARHFKECTEYLEIETIIDECAIFLSSNLENIHTIIFGNIPHEGPYTILYYFAKKTNVKTIIFYQSLFPNYSFLLKDYTPRLKYYKTDTDQKQIEISKIKINTWYMYKKSKLINKIKTTFKIPPKKFPSFVLFNQRLKILRKLPKKYIVFYLHLQPEMTTSALTKKYVNQLLAIELIYKYMPKDTYLLVKENPKQNATGRPALFFKKLSNMNRVTYFKYCSMTNNEIMQKSIFVATITGTVGWEAINVQKKVLIFGNTWYEEAPNVCRINEKDSEKIHKSVIKKLCSEQFENTNWEHFEKKLKKRAFNFYTDPSYCKSLTENEKTKNAYKIEKAIKKIIST
jgi:hypothetical protein